MRDAKEEASLVKRFNLKKIHTNSSCTVYESLAYTTLDKTSLSDKSDTTHTWWRAMTYSEFDSLASNYVLPELSSGQYLSPEGWYSGKCMTNKGESDFLVSLTYYGERSFLNAIRDELSSIKSNSENKKAWEKSANVGERIKGISGKGWDIIKKAETGILSIGVGETGSNPFVTTIIQNFMAEGKIKWKLERMMSRFIKA